MLRRWPVCVCDTICQAPTAPPRHTPINPLPLPSALSQPHHCPVGQRGHPPLLRRQRPQYLRLTPWLLPGSRPGLAAAGKLLPQGNHMRGVSGHLWLGVPPGAHSGCVLGGGEQRHGAVHGRPPVECATCELQVCFVPQVAPCEPCSGSGPLVTVRDRALGDRLCAHAACCRGIPSYDM